MASQPHDEVDDHDEQNQEKKPRPAGLHQFRKSKLPDKPPAHGEDQPKANPDEKHGQEAIDETAPSNCDCC